MRFEVELAKMTGRPILVVSFECYDLSTIMSRNGDSHIDLLKMDIEGFEFDIVNQFLDHNHLNLSPMAFPSLLVSSKQSGASPKRQQALR
jgi:hypothetical protein